jgi:hypothetical protein
MISLKDNSHMYLRRRKVVEWRKKWQREDLVSTEDNIFRKL